MCALRKNTISSKKPHHPLVCDHGECPNFLVSQGADIPPWPELCVGQAHAITGSTPSGAPKVTSHGPTFTQAPEHALGQTISELHAHAEPPHCPLVSTKASRSAPPSLHLRANLWFYTMIVLESCIFPIPPDPFFMVKGLNNIKNIWKLALICAILSTIGGCLMYWVGAWVYGHFAPNVIAACGGQKSFLTIQYLVAKWGPLAILGKTISPVPYKLLALVSGISQFSLHIFIATSFISRGIRFFALAGLLIRYQEHANRVLKKYQSWISYGGYALVAIGGLIMLVGFLVNK